MNLKFFGEGLLVCRNKDGSFAWNRIFKNAPTNAGLQYALGSAFGGVAQFTAWYAGLINLTGFTGLLATDTLSFKSWQEFTAYTGARPQWANTGSNGVLLSNGPFQFNITTNGIVHGFFIASSNVNGGTSGTLWATAVLPTDAVVTPGQVVTGTYQITAVGG